MQRTIIRGKMIDDAEFRHAFPNDLWPKLIQKVLNQLNAQGPNYPIKLSGG